MVCLVGMILGKMEKDERKMREKIVGKCVWLEGRGKEKMVGIDCFLFGSTKFQSLQNREKTRHKTFVHVKRIFGLWYFATRSSFSFSFFHSPLHLLPIFTLDFFSFSFILCFLVSSCFPFYASIFFSFFFAFFLFLFLFFYLLASASFLCFYLLFFFFFFNRDASFSN